MRAFLSRFESTRSQERPFKLDFTAYKYSPSSALEDIDLTPQLMSLGKAGQKVTLFITKFVSTQSLTCRKENKTKKTPQKQHKRDRQQLIRSQ